MEFFPRNSLFAPQNFNTDVKGWERISVIDIHTHLRSINNLVVNIGLIWMTTE